MPSRVSQGQNRDKSRSLAKWAREVHHTGTFEVVLLAWLHWLYFRVIARRLPAFQIHFRDAEIG
jgi:hypothetical protein